MKSKVRLLPHVVPALCALLFSVNSTVLAQEKLTLKSADSRLSRIERVLDQTLLEQLQKVDSLQGEIRKLRGEIESLNYEVDKLTKRNSDLYADTDRRITDLEENEGSLDFLNPDGELSEDSIGGGFMDETALPAVGTETETAPAVFVEDRSKPVIPKAMAADFGNGPRPPTGVLRDTATQAEKPVIAVLTICWFVGKTTVQCVRLMNFWSVFRMGPILIMPGTGRVRQCMRNAVSILPCEILVLSLILSRRVQRCQMRV